MHKPHDLLVAALLCPILTHSCLSATPACQGTHVRGVQLRELVGRRRRQLLRCVGVGVRRCAVHRCVDQGCGLVRVRSQRLPDLR